jgi:low temperature requirement protein LtrA
VLLFAMWWLYFDQPIHDLLRSNRQAFVWGYGHFVVFGATAAVGAGLAVFVEFLAGHTEIACWQAGASVAVPSSLYVLSVWVLQLRPLHPQRIPTAMFLGVCALVLVASASQWAVPIIGVLVAGLVALWVGRGARERHHPH